MTEPFIGQISITSFGFPPKGWALCNGQLLPINQNQALFSILGTTYGGDGRTNFALPNLQSRAPMHFGNGHTLGERAGEENHTLIQSELPTHTHTAGAVNGAGSLTDPSGNTWAKSVADDTMYGGTINGVMSPHAISSVGGSQPHPNMQPFLTLNFIIALQGIFPSQN